MFRYKLRTLPIVLALGPVVLAWAWYVGRKAYVEYRLKNGEWVDIGNGPGSIESFTGTYSNCFPLEAAYSDEESPDLKMTSP